MAIDETVHQHKILLEESEMPTAWYNIVPDLPSPPPPALHPGTLQPAGPEDFAPLFPMDLILQEVSQERYSTSPVPSSTSTASGGRALSSGLVDSSSSSILRLGSTTSTKVSPRPGPTSRTLPCRRRITTPRPE